MILVVPLAALVGPGIENWGLRILALVLLPLSIYLMVEEHGVVSGAGR